MKFIKRILGFFLPSDGWRRRRTVRQGCAPLLVFLIVCLSFGLAIFTVLRIPSFESNPFEYRLTSILIVVLLLIGVFSLLGTWFMGTLAAQAGSRAVRGQGQLFGKRMRIVRRRLLPMTLSVVLLRLLWVVCGVGSLVLIFTRVIDFGLTNDLIRFIRRTSFDVRYLFVIVASIHLILGPVLRMFYSTALGAYGASRTTDADARVSSALTARASAGLAGLLTVVWGVTIFGLIILTFNQPNSDMVPRISSAQLWPLSDNTIQHIVQVGIIAMCFFVFHMSLQAIGTIVLQTLTRVKLASREPSQPDVGWLQSIEAIP